MTQKVQDIDIAGKSSREPDADCGNELGCSEGRLCSHHDAHALFRHCLYQSYVVQKEA